MNVGIPRDTKSPFICFRLLPQFLYYPCYQETCGNIWTWTHSSVTTATEDSSNVDVRLLSGSCIAEILALLVTLTGKLLQDSFRLPKQSGNSWNTIKEILPAESVNVIPDLYNGDIPLREALNHSWGQWSDRFDYHLWVKWTTSSPRFWAL